MPWGCTWILTVREGGSDPVTWIRSLPFVFMLFFEHFGKDVLFGRTDFSKLPNNAWLLLNPWGPVWSHSAQLPYPHCPPLVSHSSSPSHLTLPQIHQVWSDLRTFLWAVPGLLSCYISVWLSPSLPSNWDICWPFFKNFNPRAPG